MPGRRNPKFRDTKSPGSAHFSKVTLLSLVQLEVCIFCSTAFKLRPVLGWSVDVRRNKKKWQRFFTPLKSLAMKERCSRGRDIQRRWGRQGFSTGQVCGCTVYLIALSLLLKSSQQIQEVTTMDMPYMICGSGLMQVFLGIALFQSAKVSFWGLQLQQLQLFWRKYDIACVSCTPNACPTRMLKFVTNQTKITAAMLLYLLYI